MKLLRNIISFLCVISALLFVGTRILSSHMQGYYKGQIDDFSKNTLELLAKKRLWVQIGESRIFFYVFMGCVFAFLIISLFIWLKKN